MRPKQSPSWKRFSLLNPPALLNPEAWNGVLLHSRTCLTGRGTHVPVLLLLACACLPGGFWSDGSHLAAAQPPGPHGRFVLSVPASSQPLELTVALPCGASHGPARAWHLVEPGSLKNELPALLADGLTETGLADEKSMQLLATIPAGDPVAGRRRFRLIAADGSHEPKASIFRFEAVDDRSLVILEGEKRTLQYNHGTITGEGVPKEDARRQRSSYIHPVWGTHGEVLTDDFPSDHYHHHGLFWTWPHVEIDGQSYDLWTDRGIEQRFVRWLGRNAGPAGARLGVENGWYVADRRVMIERVWLNVYPTRGDSQALDLHFTWIPIGHPITLQGAAGKSYGGLAMRFAIKDPADATITIPSGVAAEDLPDTPLPWADLTAIFAGQTLPSGAALFVPPEHPDYPPTWLLRHYGPLCIGWPGVRAKTFPAGKPFHLNYRVWIHAGQLSAEQIGQAYQTFVQGLDAKWITE